MSYSTLISTDKLAAHLDDPQWVVIDCRFVLSETEAGRALYRQSHIPGARYAHLDDDLSSTITADSGRHPLPDPYTLAEKLGQWGIDKQTQMVVYDDAFGAMAVRLWWLLRWLGHEAVALLNGGLPKWQREKRPMDAELPEVTPKTFEMQVNNALWVDAHTVDSIREHHDHLLIDARAEERYTGMIEPLDKVAGHIPGAINYPYEDNLAFSGEFMSAEELKGEYKDLIGNRNPVNVIHMCGSGVTACHNILAMEHAGLKGSRLYAGSWSEWITRSERPVATGE